MAVFEFNGGLVTSRPDDELELNELPLATGIWYPPGDISTAEKISGRRRVLEDLPEKIDGVAICLFEPPATSLLIILSGEKLYKSDLTDPASPGAPVELTSGGEGERLTAVHFNDQWIITTSSRNYVLRPDGSLISLGLGMPTGGPVSITIDSDLGEHYAPTDPSVGPAAWTGNLAYTRDGNPNTWAILNFPTGQPDYDLEQTIEWDMNGVAQAATDPVLLQIYAYIDPGGRTWTGGAVDGYLRWATIHWALEYQINGVDWIAGVSGSVLGSNFPSGEALTIAQSLSNLGLTQIDQIKYRLKLRYTTVDGLPWNQPILASLGQPYVRISGSVVTDASDTGAGPAGVTTELGGITYAITAWDEATQRESSPFPYPNPPGITIQLVDDTQVTLDLSDLVAPPDATHWKIYRSPDGDGVFQAGLIPNGKIPISETLFTDTYIADPVWGYDQQLTPLIPQVSLSDPDTLSPLVVWRDEAPPPFRTIAYYRGYLVGIPLVTSGARRGIRYNLPGLLHSWPSVNGIFSFPLPENDQLIQVVEANQSLIVGAEDVMIRIDEMPRTVLGTYVPGESKKIEGAPGVVGIYALEGCLWNGDPSVAWVSPYGLYVTNGYQVMRISDDIQWSGVESAATDWVLHWDRRRSLLILSTGVKFYLIHLEAGRIKQNGQPRWTGPHFGEITSLDSTRILGDFYVFSGHPQGGVYREDSPGYGLDDSNAYDDNGVVPLILRSLRARNGMKEWTATETFLKHGDFGSGETMFINYTTGRDSSRKSTTKQRSVAVDGDRWTQVGIGKSGTWHQWAIEHYGSGIGKLESYSIEARVLTRSGKV